MCPAYATANGGKTDLLSSAGLLSDQPERPLCLWVRGARSKKVLAAAAESSTQPPDDDVAHPLGATAASSSGLDVQSDPHRLTHHS